ncbi:hypothetical protein NP233_g10225 [Leucocoprinus birnbaumii]|uniref:Uncharacterized protein n=1 Tax=Leucocoprinus birnbaumii TaxID=56174 RepID=A0AAD5YMC8_9AGAR|nr:hypothetical protein NP233_g10225 [Leucocoprinus birnbaumii]
MAGVIANPFAVVHSQHIDANQGYLSTYATDHHPFSWSYAYPFDFIINHAVSATDLALLTLVGDCHQSSKLGLLDEDMRRITISRPVFTHATIDNFPELNTIEPCPTAIDNLPPSQQDKVHELLAQGYCFVEFPVLFAGETQASPLPVSGRMVTGVFSAYFHLYHFAHLNQDDFIALLRNAEVKIEPTADELDDPEIPDLEPL